MKPSFLASNPSSTYTMIGLWCRSMSKMFFIAFFELLFLKIVSCQGAFHEHCPLYQVVLWCSFFSLLPTWATCGRGHHYWVIFRHKARRPHKRFFICFGPLSISPKTIVQAPRCIFPSLIGDTHIMGPMSEVTCAFDHLSTQLALIGLKVKVSKYKLWNPLTISLDIEILQGYILVLDGLCILGVSMGTQDFTMHFLDKVLS